MRQHEEGMVFNIQNYSIHDGPGIRTVVFLKGCPFKCMWCSNPESQNDWPELGFRQSFCNGCGHCIEVCPRKSISSVGEETFISIDHSTCDNCGLCVQSCPRDALTMYGQSMALKQIMEEIAKDVPFYARSGGGVTISGGEPLHQPSIVLGILRECRQLGIHTAIETSGYCSPQVFRAVLDEADLIIFDLKMMDAERHLALTGIANQLILSNARLLPTAKGAVQMRMPLIPEINDSDDNIKATASFLHAIGIPSIELMPFHQFGRGKYAALGRPYNLADKASATPEEVETACGLFKAYGVKCRASI